jgi:hypothetical protein
MRRLQASRRHCSLRPGECVSQRSNMLGLRPEQEALQRCDDALRTREQKVEMSSAHSALRLNASERLVGRQFKLADFRFRQASDAIRETCLRDGPHLERKGYRSLRRPLRCSFDHCCPGESCPIEVCGQRNHKHRLQDADQGIALPHYDGTASGLLARTVGAKIGPPNLTTFHRRSSRSSAAAQSPRPSSASASSSAVATFDKRSRFHRAGSGRRTTTIPTRSPGRRDSRRMGRSTPFSNSASMISMRGMIAQAEPAAPGDGKGGRA